MKVKIILNPYANRWGAGSKAETVSAAFSAVGVEYELDLTQGPGEATELAMQASTAGFDAIVAAGGDGTISEVVDGLIQATPRLGQTLPFGIVPIGTANDFSDMAKIPRELLTAARIVASGKTRQIDVAQVSGMGEPAFPSQHFNNNSAVAMEPMVTLENIKMKRLSGEIRYVVALIRALVKLKAWQMRISWDDGSYEGPTYLLSICNSPRTGGFYMAPEAKMDDGLLDFVLVPEVPKRTVLAILGLLLRGTHLQHPKVTSGRTRSLELWSEPGTPVHADGEIVAEAASGVRYQLRPGKLTLLTP
jgi:YegS/Rv2252/BmrU family lipid kinase